MYLIIHHAKNQLKSNLFPVSIFVFITDINECRLDSCLCGNCADLINDYYSCSCDYGYNG